MDHDGIAVHRAGRIADIVLDRPRVRNALRQIDWISLANALDDIRVDPSVHTVLIRGAGGTFSAGFDLRTKPLPGRPTVSDVNRTILEIYRFPKPTIAVIEGACVGAAWALALACDMSIASETAFFETPFASRGLVLDAGIGWFLSNQLGRWETARLQFTGVRYSAGDALARGLVAEITPAGDAIRRAREIAEQLTQTPAGTLALSKGSLRRSAVLTLESALDAEEKDVRLNGADPEVAEARARFMAVLGKGRANTRSPDRSD